MIYTLHKYIGQELLRVFVLAAIALTLILSLGSILQPMQEYGVGPKQALSFMVYFLPITLTFVLPLAALLAGSLVYGRFASDNELDACKASGISVGSLILPGLILAFIVAVSNLLLSFQIMPTFVKLTEKSLKADAKQLLFRGIQRKGFFELPSNESYQIYADRVDMKNDVLLGVIVIKLEGNEIEEIITVQRAQIKFITSENSTKVQIIAKNANRISNMGASMLESMMATYDFGSLLDDDIKFKKIKEMQEIRDNLILFDPIAKNAEETFTQLSLELLATDINNKLSGNNNSTLSIPDLQNADHFYELKGETTSAAFTATQCIVRDGKLNLYGDVTVIEYDSQTKEIIRTLQECSQALLTLEKDGPEWTIAMDLSNVTLKEARQLKMRHVIRNLQIPESVRNKMKIFKIENNSLNPEMLSSELSRFQGFTPSPILTNLQRMLARKMQKTQVQLKSEMHSRFVFGLGCIPMIFIGIGLGIIKRGGHLLSAFGVGCIPAAVLVVCIMGGKQLTENLGAQSVSGVTLMWAGLGVLCLLSIFINRHLQRN